MWWTKRVVRWECARDKSLEGIKSWVKCRVKRCIISALLKCLLWDRLEACSCLSCLSRGLVRCPSSVVPVYWPASLLPLSTRLTSFPLTTLSIHVHFPSCWEKTKMTESKEIHLPHYFLPHKASHLHLLCKFLPKRERLQRPDGEGEYGNQDQSLISHYASRSCASWCL